MSEGEEKTPIRSVGVIPAHNEEAAIGDVVMRARRHLDVVIVVDDGSRDATSDRAREAGARVLRLDPNRGKGGALVYGLSAACELSPETIVTLDADGEHDPDAIPSLIAALDDADIALGHREVYRSGPRKLLNELALFWFQLLDPAIKDTICGFRAFRTHVVPGLQNDSGGFVFEHEVILRAILAGHRLAAVKIETSPLESSHVTPREILRANNHFDRWVLDRLGELPIPLWRKSLLAVGCVTGLAIGLPAAWALGRGDARAVRS